MTNATRKIAVLLTPLAALAVAGGCSNGPAATAPVNEVVATNPSSPAGAGSDVTAKSATTRTPSSNKSSDKPSTKTPSNTGSSNSPAPASSIEPTKAKACDGRAVLCVDGGAAASGADGSAARPFATVKAAVAAAQPGGMIQVAKGTYNESVTITEVQGLTIVGGFPSKGDFNNRDAAPDDTVLKADGNASVVSITGSTKIRVEGLRLTGGGGGAGVAVGTSRRGGGVDIDEASSDVTIAGNRIDNNEIDRDGDPADSRGGGISSQAKNVVIAGNVIEKNRAGRGSGVAAVGETRLEGNTVRDNVSVGDHGGGLYLSGELTVIGNLVTGNRVGIDYSWGGGIIVFNDGTEAVLQGNVVTGNTALSAGSGVFVDDGANAKLSNELYYGNTCTENGGEGLFVDSGGTTPTEVDATNLTITGHDCPSERGHGVFADRSEASDPAPRVTVTNSIVWGNGGREVESVGEKVNITFTLSNERLDGEGNIEGDPLFANPASGDFSLRPSSPAIDAGNPKAKFDTEPQPNGSRIDLGHTGNTQQARSAS